MHNKNRTGAAAVAAAGGEAGGVVKEKIFSLIRRIEEDGITDGRGRRLWIEFTPNIATIEDEDGYTVWLWREGVIIKITLDREFNVTGFDVERPCP